LTRLRRRHLCTVSPKTKKNPKVLVDECITY